LPGVTPALVSFIAYEFERRVSSEPERFGTGVIQGVAAPEGANNAATSAGSFLFSALASLRQPACHSPRWIDDLRATAGPMLFEQNPDFVWAVIASMYIGNTMLLVLNLPLVGVWARMIKIPYHYLGPCVLMFCFIGATALATVF